MTTAGLAQGEFQNLLEVTPKGGWEKRGGEASYIIEDDMLIGTSVQDPRNTFLCTVKEYGDFEMILEVKVDTAMNSGIQIRSLSLPTYHDGRVHGYQIEIDPSPRAWSGGIYDEGRRGWLADLKDNPEGRKAFKNGEFNTYRILAEGNTITTWVNGVQAARLEDDMTASGFIAFQVHGTNKERPMRVIWKNIRIREL